eukprot:GFUD01056070.1.p1 GENE.GFUD01056070.1~~GFUD01056070.1.p1  ORF type:complete len:127 (-),score=30.48 GFUD01056070.1:9-389(-)
MPLVTLVTNLKAASLPTDAMPRLIRFIAPLMNKPQEVYNWVLETDKVMSKGSDNSDKPYVWLKIEAIGTFEDPENIKVLTPKLFDFFKNELTIEQDCILMNFYNLAATHIGKNGTTVAQLRAGIPN